MSEDKRLAEYQARLQTALETMQKMRARLEAVESRRTEPIAVIGLSCRFPGEANDPASFWQLLLNGVDAIGEVPHERWDIEALYDSDPQKPGKMSARWGGFLKHIDQFDAQFFGISPREARSMDPQQRLLLEASWQALEHAGLNPSQLSGSQTGVFVGITVNDYLQLQNTLQSLDQIDAYRITGNSLNSAAGRLSYFLGFHGPSMAIDTACSSSLVATHLAVQSLRNGESNMALAAGVNLILSPEMSVGATKASMLAPDGHCKTFDARADGFVRSEGCGVVVLKRLSDAQADGDTILALIRGSAVNQDGFSSGLTVPNKLAQEMVIRTALKNGNVKPHEIQYVEAHGTGTSLGDPIEVRALTSVLSEGRAAQAPFKLGSVKTNIGHTESAAGIAGLIKTVLALQHGVIPPHLHFQTPTPMIDWDKTPAIIPTQPTEWTGAARFAAVSAFGASGTNAHVILESAPQVEKPTPTAERTQHILALSAKSESALKELAHQVRVRFAGTSASTADISYTANTGRAHFNHRMALSAGDAAEMQKQLTDFLAGQDSVTHGYVEPGRTPKIAFLFTGHGSQYVNMGRELYETSPIFHAAVLECEALLTGYLEIPISKVLYPEPGDVAATANLWEGMKYTQPAQFVVAYALVKLWAVWGLTPGAVIGHSVGEYAAACAAGVMSLADGLKLVAARGRLMESLPEQGVMTAVFAEETTVAKAIAPYADRVSIAVINGPTNIVISGNAQAVETIQNELTGQAIKSKRLDVAQASHSPIVDPMLDEFERIATTITYREPQLEYISSLLGHSTNRLDAQYWRQHQRQAVRFADGLQTLLTQGYTTLIEIGPTPTLITIAQRNFDGLENAPTYFASLRKGQPDWAQMLNTLAGLYVQGATVNWRGFDQPYPRRRVTLPTYPFQRHSYWLTEAPKRRNSSNGRLIHPLLGARLRSAGREIIFENEVGAQLPAFLADHVVQGQVILPATGYLEMLRAAGHEIFKTPALSIEDLVVHAPLQLSDSTLTSLQTIITQAEDVLTGQIFSQAPDSEQWQLHVSANVRKNVEVPATISLTEMQVRSTTAIVVDEHYQNLADRGLSFGPAFRGLTRLQLGKNEAVARVEVPESLAAEIPAYGLHPAMLDAALQAIGGLLPNSEKTYLPISIETVRVFGPLDSACWSHAVLIPDNRANPELVKANVQLYNDHGQLLVELLGFAMKQVARTAVDTWLYEVQWQKTGKASTLTAEALAAALQPILLELTAEPELLKYHQEFSPRMEALSAAFVKNALLEMGWTYKVNDVFALPDLAQQLKVAPQHTRLLGRLVEMMVEDGYLALADGGWKVLHPLEAQKTASEIADLRTLVPAAQIEVDMVERIGRDLAKALRGERDALELLFPGGSLDAAETLYREAPRTRNFNQLVAQAVREIVSRWSADRPLRILEIGAGTGGTTAHVLQHLNPASTEYTFTDISPLFLSKAQHKFFQYGFVQYRTLDIEQAPMDQGFEAHTYDLVLATNVLHATADLHQTLQRVHQLLTPDGLLLAVEGTRKQRFADLVVGLTPGWWAFTDINLRPSYALLDQEHWRKLLSETGFSATQTLAGETIMSDQALLIGQAGPLMYQGGNWLVLGQPDSLHFDLINKIRANDQAAILVTEGQGFFQDADSFQVNPLRREDFQKLLEAVGSCQGIVYAWALNQAEDSSELQSRLCGGLLHLTQALIDNGQSTSIWVVTHGAESADGQILRPDASTLWGLSRVINQEHPELVCRTIDLDLIDSTQNQVDQLWIEISTPDTEDQVAYRNRERLSPRLMAAKKNATPKSVDGPQKLIAHERGVLENLTYEPLERRAPGPSEVEIQVFATGIGFRDVLNTLGMYPGGGELGSECAGVITAVGAEVSNVQVGDSVIAVALGSFATHVITPVNYVVRKPTHLSFAEAATIPSAFLTTQYALHTLAHMQAGDRVLIHAAAGGVGLAAIQLAQQAGAEIFGTAGSPAKRELLQRLGVQHILDSRTLDFADEILRLTNGQGVDIVLNSLADEFIAKSVSALAENGHFVEIGKRAIWTAEQFAQVKPYASYSTVDLILEARQNEALIPALFEQIMPAFENETLSPLPLRAYPASKVVDAFRYMAMGRHTGKLVITQESRFQVRADATYLITGAFGGLGLATAQWLVEQGAKHLALVGRHTPRPEAQAIVQSLSEQGVNVQVFQADVAQRATMQTVLAQIKTSMAPLKGLIYAAGALEDGVLSQQTWERFEKVFASKVNGSWILHELTKGLPLDFFVLYSSAVSLLGSAGQANHVAACTYQDMLAEYRRSQGLPGLSIGWGPWEQIGAAAEREVADRHRARGIESIPPNEGIQALAQVLQASHFTHAGVVPVNWLRFGTQTNSPFFSALKQQTQFKAASAVTASNTQPGTENDLWKRLESAPVSKRRNLLLGHVREQALKVLNLPGDFPLEQRQPLQELGLDSLMAVELRNLLRKGLPFTRALPATLVFDYPTPEALTRYLMEELFVKSPTPTQAIQPAKKVETVAVEELSDAEAEALLLAELNELQQKKSGKP